MLNSSNSIKPFNAELAFRGNKEAFYRFLISVSLLNFLPILHLAFFLISLKELQEISIQNVFVVFLLAFSVFGYAKIYYSVITNKNKEGKYRFYSRIEFEKIVEKNPEQKIGFNRHFLRHLVPGCLYVIIPVMAFLCVYPCTQKYQIIFYVMIAVVLFVSYVIQRKSQKRFETDADSKF